MTVLIWEQKFLRMNIKEENKVKELNSLYQEIKNTVLSISGFEWDKIVIKFTKDETHSGIGIFYKINDRYVFANDLVKENQIDESEYDTVLFSLADTIIKVKRVSESNELPEWNSMIFSIKRDSECEANYSFEEWGKNMFFDEVVWRYKYLNIMPSATFMKYIDGVEQTLL